MTLTIITLISLLLLILTSGIDLILIFCRDLMMLQQNSYRNERYLRWFNQSGESTSLLRIFACIGLMFMLIAKIPILVSYVLCIIITLWQVIYLAGLKYKKPLVWTSRAKRIYGTMLLLAGIITSVLGVIINLHAIACAILAIITFSPIILIASNDLLKPVEKRINKNYYNDAKRILQSMPELKIIGITGSYGKTSTKHFLCRILEEEFSTAITPGSFNTTMGVIRTIREYLKPYNEVFIVEMGAKQPNDIKEICDLVHPQIGIITAVGEQHLESFKTIENVQRTKFELADALPTDGLLVANNDYPFITKRPVENCRCLRYSLSSSSSAQQYTAYDIKYSVHGTTFTVAGEALQEPLILHTKLVGECNISNLLAAIIVALHLGVSIEKIKYAVGQINYVEHRLSIKHIPGGVTIIDDAFNSNPRGAQMALDVLAMMQTGKRIIITPGMIELGEQQYEANRTFGSQIAKSADIAIIVGEYNRKAIVSGIKEAAIINDNMVFTANTFAEAQTILHKLSQPGDIVLYENDLPDTFK